MTTTPAWLSLLDEASVRAAFDALVCAQRIGVWARERLTRLCQASPWPESAEALIAAAEHPPGPTDPQEAVCRAVDRLRQVLPFLVEHHDCLTIPRGRVRVWRGPLVAGIAAGMDLTRQVRAARGCVVRLQHANPERRPGTALHDLRYLRISAPLWRDAAVSDFAWQAFWERFVSPWESLPVDLVVVSSLSAAGGAAALSVWGRWASAVNAAVVVAGGETPPSPPDDVPVDVVDVAADDANRLVIAGQVCDVPVPAVPSLDDVPIDG